MCENGICKNGGLSEKNSKAYCHEKLLIIMFVYGGVAVHRLSKQHMKLLCCSLKLVEMKSLLNMLLNCFIINDWFPLPYKWVVLVEEWLGLPEHCSAENCAARSGTLLIYERINVK